MPNVLAALPNIGGAGANRFTNGRPKIANFMTFETTNEFLFCF